MQFARTLAIGNADPPQASQTRYPPVATRSIPSNCFTRAEKAISPRDCAQAVASPVKVPAASISAQWPRA
jgi:hypothetical protein